MTASPRVRLSAKTRREMLLEAATRQFLARGFSGVTLSEIIREGGGSREAIYQEFGDKAGLFAAAASRALSQQLDHFVSGLGEEHDRRPIEETLQAFGMTLMQAMLSPQAMALHRIAISESAHFPDIGRLMYEKIPSVGAAFLSAYLERMTVAGEIRAPRPDRAAWGFIALVQGNLHIRAEYHPGWAPPMSEVEEWVAGAVELFLDGLRVHPD